MDAGVRKMEISILLLGIYPKELKAGMRLDICTPLFKAVLFTVAKRPKQTNCPTTDEWLKKMWCIHTKE